MNCVRPIELKGVFAEFAGDPAAIFPNMVFLQKIDFPIGYALVGLQLSSSLVIYDTDKAGIVVVIGQTTPRLAFSSALNSPICHITQPNSIVGPPVVPIPTSKVSSLSFGQFAHIINPGTPVSLYGFGNTSVTGNDMFAVLSLQLARLK